AIDLCILQSLPFDQDALVNLVSVLERKGDREMALTLREQFKKFSGLRDQWLSGQLGDAHTEAQGNGGCFVCLFVCCLFFFSVHSHNFTFCKELRFSGKQSGGLRGLFSSRDTSD